MGATAAKSWNYPGKPPLTVDASVRGILEVVGFGLAFFPSQMSDEFMMSVVD